jgi:ATP-dependent exoDNAse (exonuclease V) alpha subunit
VQIEKYYILIKITDYMTLNEQPGENKVEGSFDKLAEELDALVKQDNLPLNPKPVSNGLREDQQKALAALNEWAYRTYRNRDEQNFFALIGSAGTGKTTLLGTFLSELKFPYRSSRICICAPTHKAKKVLQQKTKWRNAETLQALIGIKMDTSIESFDPNKPEFSQIGERKMRDYEMVIVDEASMVNSALFNTIVECAIQSGTKVLFVGDSLQLNPVGEYGISPALITPINKYELTQIIRQEADNPLIGVLTALRSDILDGTSHYIRMLRDNPTNINDKGQGYVVCAREQFAEAMKKGLNSEDFSKDKNFCRYIAWTNDAITGTNKWIREKAVGKERFF